jgi:hypothetical protein
MTTKTPAQSLTDLLSKGINWDVIDTLEECDDCGGLTTSVSEMHLCADCQERDDNYVKAQERDAVQHAILYGDITDVLQALGDPGDGDLADYL